MFKKASTSSQTQTGLDSRFDLKSLPKQYITRLKKN